MMMKQKRQMRAKEKIVRMFMEDVGYMYNDRFIKKTSPYYGESKDATIPAAYEVRLQFDEMNDDNFELCCLFRDMTTESAFQWLDAYCEEHGLNRSNKWTECLDDNWFYVHCKLDDAQIIDFSKRRLCA